jgi:MoxR-like ATPase
MLQSMQEKTVTVGKFTYPLPKGFTVLATQNPIEQEGTYNLPEAQQDRFRIWVDVTYPTEETDYKIAKAATATSVYKTFEQLNGGQSAPGDFNFDEEDSLTGAFNANSKLRAVMTREQVLRLPQIIDQMPAGEDLLRAVARVVNAARPHTAIATAAVKESLEWGPGPRADQALVLCAKANALMRGDLAPSKDDLREILEPVMKLRMGYKWNAQNDPAKKAAVINSLKAVI